VDIKNDLHIVRFAGEKDNILNWSSRERMSGRKMVHIFRKSDLRLVLMSTTGKLRLL